MRDISSMLGTRYPLIQGAMGVICNPELVAAVSEAGGFGLLATGFLSDPDRLSEQISTVRRLTEKPFGVNLMAGNPMSMTFAEIVADEGIPAVTTSAGSPAELVSWLRPRGVRVLHVVPAAEAAVKAQSAGVDAVIAEGTESGGMQGFTGASTLVLVPVVVDAVSIPVVAAGGIGDARGYRAAFALGAAGVQVGTRFIASEECIAHSRYKQLICEGRETDTVLVTKGRVRIRAACTPLSERLAASPAPEPVSPSLKGLKAAWVDGDVDAHTLPAGEIQGMVQKVQSVRRIIEKMVEVPGRVQAGK